jgi:hypothetical protein
VGLLNLYAVVAKIDWLKLSNSSAVACLFMVISEVFSSLWMFASAFLSFFSCWMVMEHSKLPLSGWSFLIKLFRQVDYG